MTVISWMSYSNRSTEYGILKIRTLWYWNPLMKLKSKFLNLITFFSIKSTKAPSYFNQRWKKKLKEEKNTRKKITRKNNLKKNGKRV